jgi:predicted nuclease of predicted toxin-antitoxin system
VKFHTDENVSQAVAQGLRNRGLDVTTTQDVGLQRARDEDQLAFALQESRAMVTHDADMLRLARAGASHAGIAYCHVQKYRVGELIRRLLALSARLSQEAMRDRIEFL